MLKYKWVKRGRLYSILSVPIFTISKERNITEENLISIIDHFNNDKLIKQYLPRIFLGHNTNDCDKVGIGFLDNLNYNKDTKIIYGDFIDIDEDNFYKLKDLKYPYHSVEYMKNEITGLALLDSIPPHFKFPRRILENEGSELPELYNRSITMVDKKDDKDVKVEKVEQIKPESFHDTLASIEVLMKQLVESMNMLLKQHEEPIKTAKKFSVDDASNILKSLINSIESDSLEDISKEEINKMLEPNEIQSLFDLAVKLIKEKAPDATEEDVKKLAEKFIYSKNLYDALIGEVKQPKAEESENNDNKRFQAMFQKLTLSNKLANMGFYGNEKERVEKTLEKFSSLKDKEVYLESLDSMKEKFSTHTMTNVANEWSQAKPDKYAALPTQKQMIARKAHDVWSNTANHYDRNTADKFKKQWPSSEKFVDHVLNMEDVQPGYLTSLCVEI